MDVLSKNPKTTMAKIIKKRLKSFVYAYQGIRDLFTYQPNIFIHFFMGSAVIVMGIYFSISTIEWCLLIFSITLVFMSEAFNTALEYLTDLTCPEYHPLAGRAKDVAAAAVLIAAFGTAVIGLIIFLPKIYHLAINLLL